MLIDLLALLIGLALIAIAGNMIVNVLAFPRLQPVEPHGVAVSAAETAVLIPARNEAKVIGATVRALLDQHPPVGRLIVLDDGSTDGTAALARAAAAGDPRLTVVSGAPLPAGWLGKNWACHQLSELANKRTSVSASQTASDQALRGPAGPGSRAATPPASLLFTDADVIWRPGALAAVLAERDHRRADLATVWPSQITETWGERLVVPLMAFAILGYLPVLGVHHARSASFAAANGQCVLFKRAAYAAVGGHAALRGDIVEDVGFARRVKQVGLRLRMADGAGLVGCRMYGSWPEVRDGFAKNILAGHGGSLQLAASTLFHLGVFVLPWLLAAVTGTWGWLALGLLGLTVRALSAAATGQRLRDAALMPVSVLAMTVIAARAVQWHFTGGPRWKGRGPVAATHPPLASQREPGQ